MPGESSYTLTNQPLFTSRVNSIFAGLDSLEKKHSEAVKDYQADDVNDDDEDDACEGNSGNNGNNCNEKLNKWRRDKGRGDSRKRKMVGFVDDPSKWQKYSLKEDGSSTAGSKNLSSDQLNTAVALEFLDTRKTQNDEKACVEQRGESVEQDSLVFKAPLHLPDSKKCSALSNRSLGTSHAGKARCMDTYEFGQKTETQKHEPVKKDTEEKGVQEVTLNFEQPEDVDGDCDANTKDNTDVNTDANTDGMEVDREPESKTFMSRGKKKNRSIRKRIDEDDE